MALREMHRRTEPGECFVRVMLRSWAGQSYGRFSRPQNQVPALRVLSFPTLHAEIALAYGTACVSWTRSDHARTQRGYLYLQQLPDVPRAVRGSKRWLWALGHHRRNARRDDGERRTPRGPSSAPRRFKAT